ncbi:TetR/AcrR family transcriptional regulator [Deinococcus rubellus]|uniref:TetR/AcrR family transcriptional regulator n=1 Tax=Deinococcus rubellus TaxID=1889240 RepID=UPI0031F17367
MDRNHSTRDERQTYRHGDLRNALINAGLELVRGGGPDALTLREVTRQVGVAPNAAYRHFKDRAELLACVCSAAQADVARGIEAHLAQVDLTDDPATNARSRFRAVGLGYLHCAQAEPGVFRAAFGLSGNLSDASSPERSGASGLTAFQLLGQTLDELVTAGVLPVDRRPNAEFLAWSAVHGLATLLIDGPLRALPSEAVSALELQLVLMVERGL